VCRDEVGQLRVPVTLGYWYTRDCESAARAFGGLSALYYSSAVPILTGTLLLLCLCVQNAALMSECAIFVYICLVKDVSF